MNSDDPQHGAAEGLRTRSANALAAVGYLPLLFFIPLLAARGDPLAQSHARHSLILQAALISFWFLAWVLDFVLGEVLGSMLLLGFFFKGLAWVVRYPVGLTVSIAYIAIAAVGIARSLSGQYWRIPVVGACAERLGL